MLCSQLSQFVQYIILKGSTCFSILFFQFKMSHLLIGLGVSAGEAGAGVDVGAGIVRLGTELVLVCGALGRVQTRAHVHPQRAQAADCAPPRPRRPRALSPRPLLVQRRVRAPHLQRALLQLRAQVQPHVAEPSAVRVAASQTSQRGFSTVQVAILQKVLVLGLCACHESVFSFSIPTLVTN